MKHDWMCFKKGFERGKNENDKKGAKKTNYGDTNMIIVFRWYFDTPVPYLLECILFFQGFIFSDRVCKVLSIITVDWWVPHITITLVRPLVIYALRRYGKSWLFYFLIRSISVHLKKVVCCSLVAMRATQYTVLFNGICLCMFVYRMLIGHREYTQVSAETQELKCENHNKWRKK